MARDFALEVHGMHGSIYGPAAVQREAPEKVVASISPRQPPLTAAELQELNRTVKSEMGRRLLWEIHRLRAILLRANELQIMIRDDRFLGRDVEILKRVKALRELLDSEPVVLEEQRKEERRSNWKKGLRV